jgi:hypothetical protein
MEEPEASMSLVERIQADLVAAMKAKEAARTAALRLIKSALQNKEIEKRGALTDADAVAVLKTLLKQRTESIEQFEAAGRKDLAEKERQEKAVLEAYLPAAVTVEEMDQAIGEVVAALSASGPKDLGRVMKEAMARLQQTGKMVDGKALNERVRARLQG